MCWIFLANCFARRQITRSSFESTDIFWSFNVQQLCCDNTCVLHTSEYVNVIYTSEIDLKRYVITGRYHVKILPNCWYFFWPFCWSIMCIKSPCNFVMILRMTSDPVHEKKLTPTSHNKAVRQVATWYSKEYRPRQRFHLDTPTLLNTGLGTSVSDVTLLLICNILTFYTDTFSSDSTHLSASLGPAWFLL